MHRSGIGIRPDPRAARLGLASPDYCSDWLLYKSGSFIAGNVLQASLWHNNFIHENVQHIIIVSRTRLSLESKSKTELYPLVHVLLVPHTTTFTCTYTRPLKTNFSSMPPPKHPSHAQLICTFLAHGRVVGSGYARTHENCLRIVTSIIHIVYRFTAFNMQTHG